MRQVIIQSIPHSQAHRLSMSLTDENSINLADLPSDIVRNIVEVGVEFMNTMRLVSEIRTLLE